MSTTILLKMLHRGPPPLLMHINVLRTFPSLVPKIKNDFSLLEMQFLQSNPHIRDWKQ